MVTIGVFEGDGRIEGSDWDLAMTTREKALAEKAKELDDREAKLAAKERNTQQLLDDLDDRAAVTKLRWDRLERARTEFETYKSSYGNPDEVHALIKEYREKVEALDGVDRDNLHRDEELWSRERSCIEREEHIEWLVKEMRSRGIDVTFAEPLRVTDEQLRRGLVMDVVAQPVEEA